MELFQFAGELGSTGASPVVRRALAANISGAMKIIAQSPCRTNANDEGVVGCARDGRAPQHDVQHVQCPPAFGAGNARANMAVSRLD